MFEVTKYEHPEIFVTCRRTGETYKFAVDTIDTTDHKPAGAMHDARRATLPLFAGGLGFVGYLTGRRKRKAGQALAAA